MEKLVLIVFIYSINLALAGVMLDLDKNSAEDNGSNEEGVPTAYNLTSAVNINVTSAVNINVTSAVNINVTSAVNLNVTFTTAAFPSFVTVDNRSRQGIAPTWRNCPNCGTLKRTRIVGGRKTSISDCPWMVSIHKNGAQHCGASALDNRHLLTAAHCVHGINPKTLLAIASTTNVYANEAFRASIQSYVVHPRFEPETYDYDVAVLTLDRRIPLNDVIRPICLPDPADDPEGLVCVVNGWGALDENSNVAPSDLRTVELPIISNDECRKAPGLKGQKVTDRMMCAGYIQGRMDACAGDSGGPLTCKFNDRWVQSGIVSWGIGCARSDYYGVFTRVPKMLSWVANNINNAGCK